MDRSHPTSPRASFPALSVSTVALVSICGMAAGCGDQQDGRRPEPTSSTGGGPAVEPNTPPAVTVDPETTYQTLDGFGAAVAWYQGTLVNHPLKAEVYDHIFSGLGLDILRFRNRYGRTEEDDSLEAEVEIFERAVESLGRVPALLLTSWSPPGELKESGRERCTGDAAGCTLARDSGKFRYDDFAEYWLASVQAYRDSGIGPDLVSIQNEPSFVPPDWEGCQFAPTETDEAPGYDQALERVHDRFSTLDSPPKLLGPETLGIHYRAPQRFLEYMDLGLVHRVAHHLYEQGGDGVWDWQDPGPNSYTDEMSSVALAAGDLPLYQTEFQTDDDGGINGGFETAWLLHYSLTVEQVVAWLYWDLVWANSGGLVTLTGETYSLRDQYFAVRHFSRYTDPGYVRVEADSTVEDVLASAYRSPDKSRTVVVVLNVGDLDLTVPVSGLGGETQVVRTTFRPGESETWQDLGALDDEGTLELPSRSVATVVATE